MEYKDVIFITDLHLAVSSRVRTGDYLQDLCDKLNYVVDYCNKVNAVLLIGGDICDKPSLPDVVKNMVFPIFKKLKTKCFTIPGNHDLLYNNEEFLYKTTYQTLVSADLIEDISNKIVDLGGFYISNVTPIEDKDKPIIFTSHGFLNKDDGKWSFYYQDIKVKSTQCYICLGHDHVVYEPIQYTQSVKILRPGSFVRGIRLEEHERQPEMLHIRCIDGSLKYRMVPIVCRDYKEIFKTKEAKGLTKTEITDRYEDIINKIRSANVSNLSFEQALKQVADDETVLFTIKLLEDSRLEKSITKSRL